MTSAYRIPIGVASFPSGIALLIDFGTLHLWQHTRPPIWPDAAGDPAGDGLVDLVLGGPHAEHAGRALGRQWHPWFLYDTPREDVPQIANEVAQLASRGIQANVSPLAQRVPHRQRVDHALQLGRGAGEVPFFAMHAIAAAGLPPGVPLAVVGGKDGPDAGQWNEVSLEAMPNAPVAHREKIGTVLVDCARLAFGDVDAIAHWNHARSGDGLADFLFWGRDAEAIARQFGAPPQGDGQFGWKNLPEAQVRQIGGQIEHVRATDPRFKFATDFRPHTSDWAILEQIRSQPTESGVLDVGGARITGFMTTWGDGAFDVFRDLDAHGRLVRLTVVFSEE